MVAWLHLSRTEEDSLTEEHRRGQHRRGQPDL